MKSIRFLALVLFLLICGGAFSWWFLFSPATTTLIPPSNSADDPTPPFEHRPSKGGEEWQGPTKADAVVAEVGEESGVFEFEVKWIGEAVEGSTEIPVLHLSNTEVIAKATLNQTSISFKTVDAGEYSFDFAASEIFCPDHYIEIKNKKAVLKLKSPAGLRPRKATEKTDSLLLSKGVMVDIVAIGLKGPEKDNGVEITWWPKARPYRPRSQKYKHLVMEAATPVLLPVNGIDYMFSSDKYWISKPERTTFHPATEGRRLEITFGTKVPIVIEVYEQNTGGYLNELGLESAEDETNVMASFNIVSDGKSLGRTQGNRLLGRTLNTVTPRGNAVDSFTVVAAILDKESSIQVRLQRHGGPIFAIGLMRVSPLQTEIVVPVHMIEKAKIEVSVVDQNGSSVEDVEVIAGLTLVLSKLSSTAAGADVKGRTDAKGKVKIGPVSCAPYFKVSFRVTGLFVVNAKILRVEDAVRDGVTIVVRTTDGGMLRFSVVGNPIQCTAMVLEGEKAGVWHYMSVPSIELRGGTDSAKHLFKETSRYFRLIVKTDDNDTYFVREDWIKSDVMTYGFDLATTTTRFLSADISGNLFPYRLEASVAKISVLSNFDKIPSTAVIANRVCQIRLEQDVAIARWTIVPAKSPVRSIYYIDRASSKGSPVDITSEEVGLSKLDVTVDAKKLKNVNKVSILVTPVFLDNQSIFHTDLRLSIEKTYDDLESGVSFDLPFGRYVLIVTYEDKGGTLRPNLGPGGRAEFEIIENRTTKVHLPIG